MSTSIILELPLDLEQRMREEAQRQHTTVEALIVQKLQQDYPEDDAPQIDSLEDLVNAVYFAVERKQASLKMPAAKTFIEMAESLERTGVLLDFQVRDQVLILSINPHPPKYPLTSDLIESNPSELEPDLAEIAARMENENPQTRMQAIHDLVQWHEQRV
jgi:ribosomal protein S8